MYPTQVDVSEKAIAELTQTLKTAYKSIVDEIATATDFGVANRKVILAQIEKKLTDIGVDVQEFIKTEITSMYRSGADDAVKQLSNVGAPIGVSEGFNRVHMDAIAALVDDTGRSFAESLTGIDRSANLLLGRITRETITQKLAEGLIGGKARKEAVKIIKGQLQDQGLAALIDKGGRRWELDRYADMLFRTKAVEARNRGMINRMAENGYDLVQVSSHNSDHEECRVWEGQILSMRGATKGYKTVADAEREGLFHPNCKHAINVLIPSLAKQTQAYNPKKPTVFVDPKSEAAKRQAKLRGPGGTLLQPYEKIVERELLPKAEAWKPEFDKKLSNISKQTGIALKEGPVKKAPRTAEKVLYDYNGDVFAMKDVNRAVFFINDPRNIDEFNKLVQAIEKQFNKLDPKDIKRGLDITDSYASSKISVKTPYGAKAEIQITTPEMWKAKTKLQGDKMYGEWRDPLTSAERKRFLFNEMEKLYSEANRITLERLKA